MVLGFNYFNFGDLSDLFAVIETTVLADQMWQSWLVAIGA